MNEQQRHEIRSILQPVVLKLARRPSRLIEPVSADTLLTQGLIGLEELENLKTLGFPVKQVRGRQQNIRLRIKFTSEMGDFQFFDFVGGGPVITTAREAERSVADILERRVLGTDWSILCLIGPGLELILSASNMDCCVNRPGSSAEEASAISHIVTQYGFIEDGEGTENGHRLGYTHPAPQDIPVVAAVCARIILEGLRQPPDTSVAIRYGPYRDEE